ncbi:baculoviral IAP repeat-containing protein 8-like [Prorops nasuta]|uniref:baculoviral IAP repeat-containing protein 8-like n=1 Tax=Prorops nasuta TaxID=863751 RepID=UPI0034CDB42C
MSEIIECRNLRKENPSSKPNENSHLISLQNSASSNCYEVDYFDYRFESVRLASYNNWPVPYMEPMKLAAAGFYFTKDGDRIRCFECGIGICWWMKGNDPMEYHQKWSSRCRFVRGLPCDNVPIGVDPSTIPGWRPRGKDECGIYRPGFGPSCHNTPTPTNFQLTSTVKRAYLGTGKPKGPVHPEYTNIDARLRTFDSWPKSMPQTKEKLAEAGLYYTGKGDQTLCYYCNGGLKDWEPNEDPWEQHAKWYSKCGFLLRVKGQEYVNNVTGQQILPSSKVESMTINLPRLMNETENPSIQHAAEDEENQPSTSSGYQEGSRPQSFASSTNFTKSCQPLSEAQLSKQSIGHSIMCKVCYKKELGVVFLPCGHMVACEICAPALKTCPTCKGPLIVSVRASIS